MRVILFLLAVRVFAATEWLHIVGVNEDSPSANFQQFYDSASEFEKSCQNSDQHPRCELRMNTNPNLTRATLPRDQDLPDLEKSSARSPKEEIARRIAQAKSGDTLIVSMQDHGSPIAGVSPSCVWFSSQDKLCTNDLQKILQHKPAGVKVLISAHACFSGGFAEVSRGDVCIVASSDRLSLGFVQTRSLWNAVNERHLKTLADLAEPIFKDGNQLLLGSQMILNTLCKSTRAKLPGGGVSDLLSTLSFDTDYTIGQDCQDGDLSSLKVRRVAMSMQKIGQSLTGKSCSELQLPNAVCAARERLKHAGPQLALALQQLKDIEKLQEGLLKNAEFQKEAFIRVGYRVQALPKAEQAELLQSFVTGKEPRWNILSAPARHVWDEMAPILKFRDAKMNSQAKKNALVKAIKDKGYWDDLLTLQTCLSETANRTEFEQDDLTAQKIAGDMIQKMPVRKYKESDYEEARACEHSLRF